MMSKIVVSVLGLAGIAVVLFFGLGIYSHFKVPELGLIDGKLRPCPDSPNCVCSESHTAADPEHAILPVRTVGDIDASWQLLRDAVVEAGGDVVDEGSGYLHAEFTSPLFRFVDDLELRLDRDRGEIHIRSASRVGRSDLGANRRRVQMIWETLGEEP